MASNPAFEGENSYEVIRHGNDKDKSHEYSKSVIIRLLLINLVVLTIGFGIGFGVAYGLFKPKADQDQDVDECARNPCQNGAMCSSGFQCTCAAGYSGTTCGLKPRDCSDLKRSEPGSVSGLYTIYANDALSARVYCDMDTDMGGWTVFQRRQNGRVNFYRAWEEYADGFGDLDGDVWLGNRLLHALTRRRDYRLRVDLGDWEKNTRVAEYALFVVSSEEDKFRLTLGNYSGTAGDSLSSHSGKQFSTRDQDNDVGSSYHCAQALSGAWWYGETCGPSSLNSRYYPAGPFTAAQSQTGYSDGVRWHGWTGQWYSLKTTRMMIRPAS